MKPERAGWRRLRAGFTYLEAAATTLAPFGSDVRVLRPRALRHHLGQLGRALVEAKS